MLDCKLISVEEIRCAFQQDSTLLLYSPDGVSVALRWQKGLGPVRLSAFLAGLSRDISFTRLTKIVLNKLYDYTEPELVNPATSKRNRLVYSLDWADKKQLYLWNDGNLVYAGPFWDFPSCKQIEQLDPDLVGKVVKFFYAGDPGDEGYHTVQLTRVGLNQEEQPVLEGHDLGGAGSCTYRLDKIREKILVVN